MRNGMRGVVMTKLILVRHGMPEEGHLLQPQDPPASKTGESQAAQIADRLAAEGVGRIISSPQARARNTATPLAQKLGLAVEIVEGLAEVDRYTDRYRSSARRSGALLTPDYCVIRRTAGSTIVL
jgi:broad specificity phosphatase PhoE